MIDPGVVALVMLGILVATIMIGFPVAFTLMALGVIFGYYAYFQPDQAFFNNRVFYLLTQNTFTTMNNDVLVAIPLFLLMGYMVERSNLLDKLFLSVQLALKLMNSHDLQGLMKAGWGRLAEIMKTAGTPEERIDLIYLTLLSRPPAPAEIARGQEYLKRKRGENTAYEDLYWTVLNSTEFFFNH